MNDDIEVEKAMLAAWFQFNLDGRITPPDKSFMDGFLKGVNYMVDRIRDECFKRVEE